jgi:DNA-binding GntR family transcriptional regulator
MKLSSRSRLQTGGRPALEVPLYRTIALDIERDIAQGKYAIGDRLPPETELGDNYTVGRHTIREALRLLTEKGFIERRAGSGSTVIATGESSSFTQKANTLDELLLYPEDVLRENHQHGLVALPPELRPYVVADQGTLWHKLGGPRRLRAGDRPIFWADVYVNPKFAAICGSSDLERMAVYQKVEKTFGIHTERAKVEIFPSVLPDTLAEPLAAEEGSPALVIIRQYFAAVDEMIEFSVTTYPENRYRISMEFDRS